MIHWSARTDACVRRPADRCELVVVVVAVVVVVVLVVMRRWWW